MTSRNNGSSPGTGEPKIEQEIVENCERHLEILWKQQVDDDDHSECGARLLPNAGIPHIATGFIRTGIGCYCFEGSQYFHNQALGNALARATNYLLKRQHNDGTISSADCNFHSPPDTAFVVEALGPALELARKNNGPTFTQATRDLEKFLQRTSHPLLTGGIHTPNHRWVMVSALSWLYRLFGGRKYLLRAEEWLAEGFDITLDGEWTERSNGIYNAICDRALIQAAINFGRPELLDPVRRNLNMMQYLVHPNGELVTDYSHRQDACTSLTLARYYEPYRWMASLDNNGVFQAMADEARKLGGRSDITSILVYPELHKKVEPEPLKTSYRVLIGKNTEPPPETPRIFHYEKPWPKYIPGAAVFRFREGDFSLSILARHPEFMHLRFGDARILGVRVVPAFFGCGPIRFESIKEEGKRLLLTRQWTAWYNGPLPAHALRLDGNWIKMDHGQRGKDHFSRLRVDCEVEIGSGELHLAFRIDSEDPVPVQFVFRCAGGGTVEGPGLVNVTPVDPSERLKQGIQYRLEDGFATYKVGQNFISIGPGSSKHKIDFIRGDDHRPLTKNILINEMAPIERVIRLYWEQLTVPGEEGKHRREQVEEGRVVTARPKI